MSFGFSPLHRNWLSMFAAITCRDFDSLRLLAEAGCERDSHDHAPVGETFACDGEPINQLSTRSTMRHL